MPELVVASCLWDANDDSLPFSRCYDEGWVEKLYRGFKRNLTVPFRFVLFTDRVREFREPIEQEMLTRLPPTYGAFIEPFRLNVPMILAGLDTVIVGNVDKLARYCLERERLALPLDPYHSERSINGVALIPSGHRHIFDGWRGENDMEWLRRFDASTAFIDDLWPGRVVSYKAHEVKLRGFGKASIVYFHGKPKPHQIHKSAWLRQHWR